MGCSESPVLGEVGSKDVHRQVIAFSCCVHGEESRVWRSARSSVFNMVVGIKPKAWTAGALPPELFSQPRHSFSRELRASTKEGEINKTASLIKTGFLRK